MSSFVPCKQVVIKATYVAYATNSDASVPMINQYFMFATGIENSAPVIDGRRVDQMQKCGHYANPERDFDLVGDLGINFLRYGVPLHVVFVTPDRFDWSFSDRVFGALKARDIVPIADLCHFGVPDWLGNFQNPDFPEQFARYARAFATCYPWIQLYTPINEMFICATFSARFGWWNEQLTGDRPFVTALKHIVRANILAMEAILDVRPSAIFIQSESAEHHHAASPAAFGQASRRNAMRFLSLDLNYGHDVDAKMYEYLIDNGMTRDEYRFFGEHSLRQHAILGTDYYHYSEHRVAADGISSEPGDVLGYEGIAREYHARYRLPVMHTETNFPQGPTGDEAVKWLHRQWESAIRVRDGGIPLVGFTWYSLTDQVDWDTAMREDNGRVNPLGLYDLDRNIRPVGTAYRQLIADWQNVLPTQSVCLVAPVMLPSEYDDPLAQRRREWLRGLRAATASGGS